MKELTDFLQHLNVSLEDFEATGLQWENLLKIKEDYDIFKKGLVAPTNYLLKAFHEVKTIHSVRFRIKNTSHLIEKIIRKKIEEPDRIIDANSYRNEITDLIGLRALHLFKEDWLTIHHFITSNWLLKENPIAYYRSGDSPEHIEVYKEYGCEAKEHPFGYRSVHYLVEINMGKTTYVSEVQVRTIFEEGWSEIDHKIRYPYGKNDRLLNQFLVMFNRLSGNADEMGSYVQYLKKVLDQKENECKAARENKVAIIEAVKAQIKEAGITPEIATLLETNLNEIVNLPTFTTDNLQLKWPNFEQIKTLNGQGKDQKNDKLQG